MARVDHRRHPCRPTSRVRLVDLVAQEGRLYLHPLLLVVAHRLVQLVGSDMFVVRTAEINWELSTISSRRGAARIKTFLLVGHRHQSGRLSAAKVNEVIEGTRGEVKRASTKEKIVRERREIAVGGTANLAEASGKEVARARIVNGATEIVETTEGKTTVNGSEARSDRGIQRISPMARQSAAGTRA